MDEQESRTLSNVGRSKPALPAGANGALATRTAENGSRAVSSRRPAILQGYRIPSRSMPVRRLVGELYGVAPHLSLADMWTSVRWATLTLKFRRLSEYLDREPEGGVVRKDGEPRKALSELRQLADSISRHEASLGVTAAARAALGVDLGKMGDLAAMMAQRSGR